MNRRWKWLLALLGVLCLSCVAEPLPSPFTPDETKIILSSLTESTSDDESGSVALLGLPGAVSGYGTLHIAFEQEANEEFIQTTVDGSFVGSLEARRGDTLRLSFVVDGEESDWVALVVPEYQPLKNGGEPAVGMSAAPEQPSQDFDEAVGEGNDGQTGGGEPPAGPLESLFEILPNGMVRIETGPGFISPEDWLFVGNLVTGETVSTRADLLGAVTITFEGEPGDRILMFSQSAVDPSQTSPVSEFEIPEE